MLKDGISPLSLSLMVMAGWTFCGLLGYGLSRMSGRVLTSVFYWSALLGLLLVYSGIWSVADDRNDALRLPLGLPGLPFHLRQDLLSGYFLVVLGSVAAAVSFYSCGFFKKETPRRFGWLSLWIPVFLAAMTGVLVADDAFVFLLFWEAMALVSFFLVITDFSGARIREAGFLYLLLAHLGTSLLLISFVLLSLGSPKSGLGALSFDSLRNGSLAPGMMIAVFFLSLAGFGAKAGILPLHIWLPEAHPAAPAPVSALMSGVMLKMAIYGLVRMDLGLLGIKHLVPVMGAVILVLGAVSALFGVLHALMQHEPKRLLAYHSIENIGIILIGFGLSILFFTTHHPIPATIALSASLFHTLNHALFKSLLFLGVGSVIAETGSHDINHLGGLMRRMPYTGFFFLIGSLSISGLPPFNGFVSEWLTFQSALWATDLGETFYRSLVVLAAALLALASALTAMCFVKVVGVSFLGNPRGPGAGNARETGIHERLGMGFLAAGCIGLGIFPVPVLAGIDRVIRSVIGAGLPIPPLSQTWLWLVPVSPRQAQYSPVLLAGSFALVIGLTWVVVRLFSGKNAKGVFPTWNSGYPFRTARMQDSADAFGQPIRHFFSPFFLIDRHLPDPSDPQPEYRLKVEDPHWKFLYRPVTRMILFLSGLAERLRNPRISVYLVYSFITLFLLLILLR